MFTRCLSMRPCSQTRPGICSQTRPGISLCSLCGLSLQGRGQFLVLLNQPKQDQESLSALALDCLCQTGLTPWLVSLPFHKTIRLFILLCKILFPGPVGALYVTPSRLLFLTTVFKAPATNMYLMSLLKCLVVHYTITMK